MWKRTVWSRRLLVVGAFVASAASVSGRWAAPQVVMIYGAPLKSRVIIVDRPEIFRFVGSVALASETSPGELTNRPFVNVAFYWQLIWAARAQDPDFARKLRAADADQHGRFYPATANRKAVFVYEGASFPPVRSVAPEGLGVLRSRGVPTRAPLGGGVEHDTGS